MLSPGPDPNPVDPAIRHRREVLTLWGFAAFFLAGLVALGIEAMKFYG